MASLYKRMSRGAGVAMGSLLCVGLVDNLAVENGGCHGQVFLLGGLMRENVGGENGDVGKHAGSQRPLLLLIERRVGAVSRVIVDGLSQRQALIGPAGSGPAVSDAEYASHGIHGSDKPVAAENDDAAGIGNTLPHSSASGA